MRGLFGVIRSRLLGITVEETKFARRGFRGATEEMQSRLEQIGAAFVDGYHIALNCGDPDAAAGDLPKDGAELQGFAYEGAAMGFALLDSITPWRADRIRRFLRGAGDAHAYMVHVGVGWVWARLPLRIQRRKRRLDPLLGWLAFDGWGFHEGFFHWPKFIAGQPAPKKLCGYERRAFDQGLGRSLWFINGGNVELIAQTIANFSVERRSDLWSGIGLAATYAGIVSESSLAELRAKSGPFSLQLAQGAAFAAKARQRAANVTEYTGLATRVICGLSPQETACLCDQTLENLPADADAPPYEIWRRRIQSHFATNLEAHATK